ncbi:hypothetical protein BDV97DRAFT_349850 [Delphinella strobiligena]|nr:hypothetical protein BDV97DRAFT_349850 [Delphinella strobiligena]
MTVLYIIFGLTPHFTSPLLTSPHLTSPHFTYCSTETPYCGTETFRGCGDQERVAAILFPIGDGVDV